MGHDEAYTSLALSSWVPSDGPRKIQGRIREIVIAFVIMTLPMLLFSGLLVGLIFRFRITQNDFIYPNLAFSSDQLDSSVYFVNISATTLITVASWSSTVAPILVGFAVTLVSYPVAQGLLKASQDGTYRLPTPFQLSLIVQMTASSGYGSLWNWLIYTFGWRGRRESQGRAIKLLTSILMLGIVLSALVLAADTWLHLTTKTIDFLQVEKATETGTSQLSFGINPNCTNTDVDTTLNGCTLNNPASGQVLISVDWTVVNPMRVLSNLSDTAVVKVHIADNNQFAYLANSQLSQLENLDYTVRSYALQSKCTPVTRQCANTQNVSGVQTTFKCPFAFEGRVNTAVGAQNYMAMAYFTDSSGADNNTYTSPVGNPYYYSAITLSNMASPRPSTLQQDPEVLAGGHGGATIIGLFCNSSVYDVEYSSVNGTIIRFIANGANSSTTRIIQGTQGRTNAGNPALIQTISVAGLSDSAQEFADQFALAYSQTALAVASGGFVPRPAMESQVRRQILVARVLKAPLYCLVAANLLLVVLGIALTVVALVAVRGDTGEVQARLSIPAIVAALFEGHRARAPVKEVEDMFEEKHNGPGPRIGFGRTQEGGWAYESWAPS